MATIRRPAQFGVSQAPVFGQRGYDEEVDAPILTYDEGSGIEQSPYYHPASGKYTKAPPMWSDDVDTGAYLQRIPGFEDLYDAAVPDLVPKPKSSKSGSGSSKSSKSSSKSSGSKSSGSGAGAAAGGAFGQFTDPATMYLEQLAQAQLKLYEQQATQMAEEARKKEAVRGQTEAAVKQLSDFINGRVSKLQQPAYTGAEAEVLRTRALDPIESDRQAAKKRALENVGSRGFDPSSGIAQELFNLVDSGFDQSRATAQNDLAYRQIAEERSREQEAQQLLQYLSQLPEVSARGDLSFVQYLNSVVNQPRLEALPLASQMAELPNSRIQTALGVLGVPGVQYTNPTSGYLSLLQNAQGDRTNQYNASLGQQALNNQASGGLSQGLAQMLGLLFQPGGF